MAEYIDRQELLNKIWMGNTDSIVLRSYAAKMVNAMPTVDVIEVKHGRWKPVHHNGKLTGGKCSVCGKFKRTNNMGTLYNGYKVCHKCGAKMDGSR